MSSLRSAIDELHVRDEARLPDAELEADFVELERASRAVEAVQLRLLAEIDRRECWRLDGLLSTSQWLVAGCRIPWSEATRRVSKARALEQMPSTRQAFENGEVPSSAAQTLVAAREAHPSEFADHEEALLEAARTLSARDLRHTVA